MSKHIQKTTSSHEETEKFFEEVKQDHEIESYYIKRGADKTTEVDVKVRKK